MAEEDAAREIAKDILSPALQVVENYINRMRRGEAPLDMESWIQFKRLMYNMFEIPAGTLPDDPRELDEDIQIHDPFRLSDD